MQEFKQFTGYTYKVYYLITRQNWEKKEKKEKLTLVAFDGVVELGDTWWDFQALHQNALLSLNSDVLWPPDEAGEVSLRLDVSSDSKVAWVLFEQRIFCCRASA